MLKSLLKVNYLDKIKLLFKSIISDNRKKRNFIFIILLLFVSILSFYFVTNNEGFYSKPIAKITSITEKKENQTDGANGSVEKIKIQHIKAKIINGKLKGKELQFDNTTSFSQINDLNLKVKDEIFVSFTQGSNNEITDVKLLDLKRDKYLVYVTILFAMLILLIGGYKGFKSLTSVVINILIFSATIELFISGFNLIFISVAASILFIITSISLVGGINKKTLSAIIGTFAATIISMLIAIVVIESNHWNGIHFEEMNFLTHPPRPIFLIEILIGTLGAIIDIAISISSAINELYDTNPNIEKKVLISSGKSIGKDIMGTMSNTLVFAYISGSIPMILLLLRNGFSFSYLINISLSLEIARALTGSIGIVLSIPITIYVSVLLLKNNKIGDLSS